MRLQKAMKLIQGAEPAIRSLGASAVYVFGSTARNKATADSDVDIFIDRDPAKRFGFIELTNLELLLEKVLGSKVDLATRTSLHPAIRKAVERDAIRVL